jgi:hypothetical protein
MDANGSRFTTSQEAEGTMTDTKKTKTKKTRARRAKPAEVEVFEDTPHAQAVRHAYLTASELPGDEEITLKLALRELRFEESRRLLVSADLLEHGYVTKAKAAKLLGVSVAEIEKRTGAAPSAYCPEGRLPLLPAGIPISELLRSVIANHRADIAKLARKVVQLVTVNGAQMNWSPNKPYFERLAEAYTFLNALDAAKELGISRAAVERATRDDGPESLFAQKVDGRCGWCYSPEEIAAYKRRLERQRPGAAPLQTTCTIREAARALNVPMAEVRRRIRTAELLTVRGPRGTVLVGPTELEAALQSQSRAR